MTGDLSLNGLTVGYGATPVLSGVTLPPIGAGTMVALLGANGVGKSTLLRALAGLLPYGGRATLGGEEISAMGHFRRAARVAYLPQTLPQETSLVAYEAVISACRAVRPDLPAARADMLVEEVFGLLGIGDLAFRALNKMSGGQRQMVGLAQVLVRRPAVLLLDEPTSALDLRWQLTVLDTVRRHVAESGGLCLMALHDLNLAMGHCDTVAVLAEGRLVAFGPPEDAMTDGVLARAYEIKGRVERCSQGRPFIIADGVAPVGPSSPS